MKEKIKSNPKLKRLVHSLLVSRSRPRAWVRWFVNPFVHKKGKGAKISFKARRDLLPFKDFSLGAHSVIEDYVVLNNGVGDLHIGNYTFVGISNILIGPLEIGNNVITAQHVVMSGLNHGYKDINMPIWKQKCTTALIIIEDECWIGANAVITAGITVGKHSIVAGGSVVTRDVPPYSIVGGNPAKVLKQYDAESDEWVRAKREYQI